MTLSPDLSLQPVWVRDCKEWWGTSGSLLLSQITDLCCCWREAVSGLGAMLSTDRHYVPLLSLIRRSRQQMSGFWIESWNVTSEVKVLHCSSAAAQCWKRGRNQAGLSHCRYHKHIHTPIIIIAGGWVMMLNIMSNVKQINKNRFSPCASTIFTVSILELLVWI